MTDKTVNEPLEELRARVRAATGPDREIDAALAVALDGFFAIEPRYEGDRTGYGYTDDAGVRVCPGHGGDQLVREYTSSIDAALALVERVLPGAYVCIETPLGRGADNCAFIRVGDHDLGDAWQRQNAPLAILDALLGTLIISQSTRKGVGK